MTNPKKNKKKKFYFKTQKISFETNETFETYQLPIQSTDDTKKNKIQFFNFKKNQNK